MTFLWPVLFIAFLWWFTTGVIVVAYGRTRWLTHLWFGAATVAALAALGGVFVSRTIETSRAIYVALASGTLVWGWQVASYYLGYVTGPEAAPAAFEEMAVSTPQDEWSKTRLGHRFSHALRASLHHELFALFGAGLLFAVTFGQPNKWAFWIYLTLWLMHSSAKLNIFFGVRNFRLDFLPEHLHHLDDVLGKQESNAFFPFSILIPTCVALAFIYSGIQPTATVEQTIGFLSLATMIGLGVFEQWLLVLPVPLALWGWGLRPLAPTVEESPSPSSHDAALSSVSSRILTESSG